MRGPAGARPRTAEQIRALIDDGLEAAASGDWTSARELFADAAVAAEIAGHHAADAHACAHDCPNARKRT